MFIGTPRLLTATPNGSIEGEFQWASSDPSKATIEAQAGGFTAIATPLSEGSVTFTATEPPRSDGAASVQGSYTASVQTPPPPHATSVTITEGPLP